MTSRVKIGAIGATACLIENRPLLGISPRTLQRPAVVICHDLGATAHCPAAYLAARSSETGTIRRAIDPAGPEDSESMSERDFVMDPAVIRSLNRAIRAAYRGDDDGGETVARILVADDDAGLRVRLQELLERAGYAVTTAANGLEALESQRESPAELVITDIFMPEFDGLETIAALRRDAPEVKIIAISSDGGPEGRNYLRAAESFGAVRTFTKPVRAEELLAAIDQLLDRLPGRGE